MTAKILDGRAMASELRAELRADVERYVAERGQMPGLVIVRVDGDPASGVYSKAILRMAKEIGVQARLELLPAVVSSDQLCETLVQLNGDKTVQGIIVQMPLPAHLSQDLIARTIAAEKDIDGISVQNAGSLLLGSPYLLPSTAAAVMEMLERSEITLAGKHVVVLGRSNVVGKPLGLLLLQKNATVTICHSRTTDLSGFTRQADILIVAVARPRMVTGDMVRSGAVVIDVGINALPEGGIVGDVDFSTVSEVASVITPTPGGVGPFTNVMLLKQCMQAAWNL
jgi:methylenetetrahydrofolate dehydrogenase (NADP+)/methenyltetrahydrofolate cyclohydrolase